VSRVISSLTPRPRCASAAGPTYSPPARHQLDGFVNHRQAFRAVFEGNPRRTVRSPKQESTLHNRSLTEQQSGLLKLPRGALEEDLVHQPTRAAEQGDQTTHQRRWHLPQRSIPHPPRHRRDRRNPRRMAGLRPPLPLRWIHEQALRTTASRPAAHRHAHPRDRIMSPQTQRVWAATLRSKPRSRHPPAPHIRPIDPALVHPPRTRQHHHRQARRGSPPLTPPGGARPPIGRNHSTITTTQL
jgi:hypothetical protein